MTFQEQKDNRNSEHLSSHFILNNKDDVLGFSLKLVHTDNKLIKFADGEKKFPILEFIIKFIG